MPDLKLKMIVDSGSMELIWSGRLPVRRKSVEGFSCRLHAGVLPSGRRQGLRLLNKMIARTSHRPEPTGKPFSLQQTFAAIWASGIIPPSIIDSEFLERLR